MIPRKGFVDYTLPRMVRDFFGVLDEVVDEARESRTLPWDGVTLTDVSRSHRAFQLYVWCENEIAGMIISEQLIQRACSAPEDYRKLAKLIIDQMARLIADEAVARQRLRQEAPALRQQTDEAATKLRQLARRLNWHSARGAGGTAQSAT